MRFYVCDVGFKKCFIWWSGVQVCVKMDCCSLDTIGMSDEMFLCLQEADWELRERHLLELNGSDLEIRL